MAYNFLACDRDQAFLLPPSLARHLAPRRITVNTVDPGATDTGYASRAAYDAVLAEEPMARWGQPDDAARLIAWLASDDARLPTPLPLMVISTVVVGVFVPGGSDLAVALTVALLPIAAGIAILRYRLYDIDRLINRTLVYGLLTAMLGLVYAAAVSS